MDYNEAVKGTMRENGLEMIVEGVEGESSVTF